MFNLDDCIPEETVLVDSAGNERVYICMLRNGKLVTKNQGYYTEWTPNIFETFTIKPPELDVSKLVPGVTRLRDPRMNKYKFYWGMAGEYMLAGSMGLGDKAIECSCFPKSRWSTWTVVKE